MRAMRSASRSVTAGARNEVAIGKDRTNEHRPLACRPQRGDPMTQEMAERIKALQSEGFTFNQAVAVVRLSQLEKLNELLAGIEGALDIIVDRMP